MQQLTPGTGCYAFFLTDQGRIVADANVLCQENSFLLDTEPETPQKLTEHLDKFIIADDATLEDLTPALAMIAVEGTKSSDVLNGVGVLYRASASEEAFRIVRLGHGKPRYGEDISERYIAPEAGQKVALHPHKGCYLGQEIVERVDRADYFAAF